jgi:hypothetical protein
MQCLPLLIVTAIDDALEKNQGSNEGLVVLEGDMASGREGKAGFLATKVVTYCGGGFETTMLKLTCHCHMIVSMKKIYV